MNAAYLQRETPTKIFCKWHKLHETKETNIVNFLQTWRTFCQENDSAQAQRIQVFGNVQGVGFRPFVFGLAKTLKLHGFIRNLHDCTEILLTHHALPKNHNDILETFLFSLLLACRQEHERTRLIKHLQSIDRKTHLIVQKCNIISKTLFLPMRACIHAFSIEYLPIFENLHEFRIIESQNITTQSQAIRVNIPTDMGICKECLQDMRNKDSRFFSYAFTACINCGARYSIIESLPYDRKHTSMKNLTLCDSCQNDYNNPHNKRFHTEPISCNTCAIPMRYYQIAYNHSFTQEIYGLSALQSLAQSLNDNHIALYKGLGGFAFLANAYDKQSLSLLRKIKSRPHKPFVIMANTDTLNKLAILNDESQQVLNSAESPIVIVLKSRHCNLPKEVSNLATIGVMRPYTPALLLLFEYLPKDFVLIYTSANNKGEMIAKDISELNIQSILYQMAQHSTQQASQNAALTQQDSTQDNISPSHSYQDNNVYPKLAVFEYEREILHRIDDSIVVGCDLVNLDSHSKTKHSFSNMSLQNSLSLRSLRLARGFTPLHIVSSKLHLKVLSASFGAMQKSSLAFGIHDSLVVSPYLGDLFSTKNCLHFQETFSFFESLYGTPEVFITDKHPRYASTQIAHTLTKKYHRNGKSIHIESIYHHHAHHNALLLESGLQEAIGVIFDGSGLGDDGSIWGGEFLSGNLKKIERKLFFKPFRILGGEKNIKDCQKLTLSYAMENHLHAIIEYLQTVMSRQELTILQTMFNNALNAPYTSSVGRLFDIAGFFCGLDSIDYEGQSGELLASLSVDIPQFHDMSNPYTLHFPQGFNKASKKLSHKAFLLRFVNFSPYPYEITKQGIDISGCFHAMFQDSLQNKSKSVMALRFIDTLSFCIKDSLKLLGADYALFGGGVFANFVLCARVKQLLDSVGINSFFPQLPCNDYSISIGQLGFASQL
ncbi:carbamoyltransferase HypF [Helicobacter aurati]|uniref:acylphosphatase n=1 Tax=Helicobacter aurati TaxID=137778 RepID=A0A3D8J8G5_9HELI|nr:Sua5/YciO/YrdC/YwlC family protein [Helicobacter aurati]RDU73406.1 carbamoyltransferase HypF [Helicobacter aurati]